MLLKKNVIILLSFLFIIASGLFFIYDTVSNNGEYGNGNEVKSSIKVTFKVGDYTYSESNVDKESGLIENIPADPIKIGYTFLYWELDGKEFNFKSKIDNSITLTAKFTSDEVIEVKSDLILQRSSVTLKVGEESTIKILDLSNDKVKLYKSNNTNVATVSSDGKVKATGVGNTTITIDTDGGRKGTFSVVVIKDTTKIVEVSKVELNRTSANITVGNKVSLTISITPAEATNKGVSWTSSNNDIAVVNGGIVTGIKEGKAVITATSNNGKTATCVITVSKPSTTDVPVQNITLNNTFLSIKEGGEILLSATITPSNATNKNITWTSSNTSVATVKNGLVKGIKSGSATITAKSSNGKTATCSVTVQKVQNEVAVTGVSLNKTSVTINVGATTTLTANVTPSNATNNNITWTSSNTTVATVANGIITGKSDGYTTITAKTNNGKTATCSVKVEKVQNEVAVTGISLNKTSVTLKIGDTITLVPTISPSNATNRTVTWTSSNEKIATVKNGQITTKRSGTVTITAKTNNGKTATCKVTINGSRIHFIKPESQSDVALLESNGKFALIDTSTYSSRSAVKKYLDNLGVTDIEFLIVSHNHSDHIGAAKYLSTKFNIKKLYIKKYLANDNKTGEDLQNSKDRYNNTIDAFAGKIVYVDSNSKFKETTSGSGYVTLGDMKIYFFNTKQRMNKLPSGTTSKYNGYYNVSYYAGSSENHNSLVNLVEVNNHYALLTGDMELFSVMKDIFAERINGKISKIDIFKLPHHGSYNCFGKYDYPTKVSYTLSASIDYYVTTGLMDRILDDGTYYRTPTKVIVDGTARNSCVYSMAKGDEAKAKKIMCNSYYTLDSPGGIVFNLTHSTVTVSGGVQGKSVSSRCK